MQGLELKALRSSAGMSQAEAGEALGMSREAVGLMERDKATIEPRTIRQIDDAIRCRIDVAYSDALAGWTVTLTRPISGGRQHVVVGKYEDEDDAKRRAASLARFHHGAKVVVHARVQRDPPNTTNPSGI